MSLLKMSYKMNVMEREEQLQGVFELPDVLHVLTRVFESKTCSLDKPIEPAVWPPEPQKLQVVLVVPPMKVTKQKRQFKLPRVPSNHNHIVGIEESSKNK